MIILSQNKKVISDDLNIRIIPATGINERNEYGTVGYTLVNRIAELGTYETEERAKEVLQEIIIAFIKTRRAKESNDFFGFSIMESDTFYEMPEK